MTTFRPSGTSPGVLEEVLSVPVPKLLSNMVVSLPSGWGVVFSSQKRTLTVGPLPGVSLQELSSQVSSMTSKEK